MRRVGFTIVLNGLDHLRRIFDEMEKAFERWVIVEGVALNTGSTSWCREVQASCCTSDGLSVDGTTEFLGKRAPGDTHVMHVPYPFHNKDEMVNAAVNVIEEHEYGDRPYHLWQIDVDEQWIADQMESAERGLEESGGDCGMFLTDHYVGKNLVARGAWGEGNKLPYRRLWKWHGQRFATHEPPVLEGGNGTEVLLPQRFEHYSYWDRKDVEFKEQFYGYAGLVERWDRLQSLPKEAFPRPASDLLGDDPWAENTQIEWANSPTPHI